MSDAVSETAATPLSEGQRIIDTFVAPSKTFIDLLRRSSWWGPLVIMIVVSIAFSFTVQTKVGWERVMENNVHQSPKQEERFAQMTPDQAAAAKTIGAKVTSIIAYCFPILILIFTAITVLLVWATVNFGFAGTAKFGQVFAVYMYAGLVFNLKFLLAIIALFAGVAPDSFLMNNPVGTNIGYYLSSDLPHMLVAYAMHLDVFEIWSVILSVIGVGIVAKVSRGKAAAAVVGWWIVLVLISGAFS
ncbi:YIP1 family protein [Alloacidobacterium dinghuense]|uniref:YIP1 family protein n=1 Tax=Alloacidobacterium dinghuense TaxID=2763107 RepID=A0A7G8BH18_9BACT|nr:YIP1 family protein [Alloacidobacterium dinghuense]QNI31838.1 YIP1 family protein [Alloacidobacterium dinghuense]